MCKAILNQTASSMGFIIYNHLLSQKDQYFTLDRLEDELKIYRLDVKRNDLQKRIDQFVRIGLIKKSIDHYTISEK